MVAPEYREGVDPTGSDYCLRVSVASDATRCYYVYTNATDEKSLIYITKEVSYGAPYADVRFYKVDSNVHDDNPASQFAEGCKHKHLGINIAYNPDSCSSVW